MAVLDFLLLFAYALATFLSFGEEWYIGELAGSLRWHWLLGGLLLMLYFGLRRRRIFLAATAVLVLYHVPSVYLLATADRPPVQQEKFRTMRIYQHNTLRFFDNTESVISWLKQHGGEYDVAFLQEVSPQMNDRLNELLPQFPYIVPAYFHERFDNAVLSKYPIASFEIRMFPDLEIGYIRCRFSLDEVGTSVVMYGMHATAPVSPAYWLARNGQFAHIAKEIAEDKAALKFLVGDLNLTPYSPIFDSLMEISGLHNSMLGYGIENTWGSFLPARIFGLPIDHLLFSDGLYVKHKKVGESLGSDHFSVTTELLVPVGEGSTP